MKNSNFGKFFDHIFQRQTLTHKTKLRGRKNSKFPLMGQFMTPKNHGHKIFPKFKLFGFLKELSLKSVNMLV